VFEPTTEGAFDGGDKGVIHFQELLGRPAAVLLQIFARVLRAKHERVCGAAQIL